MSNDELGQPNRGLTVLECFSNVFVFKPLEYPKRELVRKTNNLKEPNGFLQP